MMTWSIYAASATGASHKQRNIVCQDAFAFHREKNTLIAAVCDGAGSARFSDVGARYVTRLFVQRLSELPEVDYLSAEQVKSGAIRILNEIRQQLADLATQKGHDLKDYACTLVAAWIGDKNGWLVHLGDGLAVVTDKNTQTTLSLPENGEYSNQTWFLTATDWQPHLRFTPIEHSQQLILMSDGVQPFAMNKQGNGLYDPFITPVIRYLSQVDEELGNKALFGTLDDPRTYEITGDDKTLLIAFRSLQQ